MTRAADLVRRSLKLLGVLAPGESLTAADSTDGIVSLNRLFGTWANERLLVHGVRRSTHTLTPGLSPHLMSPSGSTGFAVARPVRIEGAGIIRVGQTTETPVEVLSDAQYKAIGDKATSGAVPTRLWVEWTTPSAKLWMWPVPTTAATLVLYTWSRIAEVLAADDVFFPDGYDNALEHALALQLAPMYGVEPSGTLLNNAAEALAAIQRTNQRTPVLTPDPVTSSGGSFDVQSGDA